MTIEDVEILFENSIVHMIAKRFCPELEIAGEKLGAFEEGDEFRTKFWVGCALSELGLAGFLDEDLLNLVELHKLYWKESIQDGKRLSSLPEFFYPRLRRFLSDLKKKSRDDPSFTVQYNKARRLAQDMLSCRLKKIVGLSAAPAQTGDVLESLTPEERALYEQMSGVVRDWGSKILKIS